MTQCDTLFWQELLRTTLGAIFHDSNVCKKHRHFSFLFYVFESAKRAQAETRTKQLRKNKRFFFYFSRGQICIKKFFFKKRTPHWIFEKVVMRNKFLIWNGLIWPFSFEVSSLSYAVRACNKSQHRHNPTGSKNIAPSLRLDPFVHLSSLAIRKRSITFMWQPVTRSPTAPKLRPPRLKKMSHLLGTRRFIPDDCPVGGHPRPRAYWVIGRFFPRVFSPPVSNFMSWLDETWVSMNNHSKQSS